jgi:hypothetical protein
MAAGPTLIIPARRAFAYAPCSPTSFWLSARSRADTMEEFYCGKLVVLLIASGVGGGNQREQNVHPASQLGRSTYRARETGLDTKHRENRPSLPSRCPTA